jgi:hypothetical protein
MTIEEIQAQIDALQRALDERKRTSGAIRTVVVGDLEWQADVADRVYTRAEAIDYAQSIARGWRLPTVRELLSLVDYEAHEPACSTFPECPSEQFWSATSVYAHPSRAWVVAFGGGSVHGVEITKAVRVRLVRSLGPREESGQASLFGRP